MCVCDFDFCLPPCSFSTWNVSWCESWTYWTYFLIITCIMLQNDPAIFYLQSWKLNQLGKQVGSFSATSDRWKLSSNIIMCSWFFAVCACQLQHKRQAYWPQRSLSQWSLGLFCVALKCESALCILPESPIHQPNYWPPHHLPNSPVQVDQEEFHIQWLQKQVDIFPRQAHGLHLTPCQGRESTGERRRNLCSSRTSLNPSSKWRQTSG